MKEINLDSLMTVTGGTGFLSQVTETAAAAGLLGGGVGAMAGAASGAPFLGVGAIPGGFIGANLGAMAGIATGAVLGAGYNIAGKLGLAKNS
jgi:hypothetical protein